VIVDSEKCTHQPVYFGAVNINIEQRTIGSVDVWRCGVCKKRFCEEKQLGIESIADIVGMPKIGPDEKWAVLVSKLQKGKIIELNVKNFQIEDDHHWSFLIDEHIGKAVEI